MVDQAGQDAIEVEAAADVAGDAAQGVGAMEQVLDLVAASSRLDDAPDVRGDDRRPGPCRWWSGRSDRGRPGAARPMGRRSPGMATATSARSPGSEAVVTRSAPSVRTGTAVLASAMRCPASSARPRMPKPRGRSSRRGSIGSAPAVARDRQTVLAQLPDGHQAQVQRGQDGARDALQGVVELIATDRQAGDGLEQGEVAPMLRVGARRAGRSAHGIGHRDRIELAAHGAAEHAAARAVVVDRAGSRRPPGSAAGRSADSAGRRAD